MLTDDRDIRRTHRVGTSSQLEANFGENDAEISTVEMLAKQEHEAGDDLAVLESNRGHANDPSRHQLAPGIASGNRSSSSAVTRRAPSDIANFSHKKGRRKPAPSYELRHAELKLRAATRSQT